MKKTVFAFLSLSTAVSTMGYAADDSLTPEDVAPQVTAQIAMEVSQQSAQPVAAASTETKIAQSSFDFTFFENHTTQSKAALISEINMLFEKVSDDRDCAEIIDAFRMVPRGQKIKFMQLSQQLIAGIPNSDDISEIIVRAANVYDNRIAVMERTIRVLQWEKPVSVNQKYNRIMQLLETLLGAKIPVMHAADASTAHDTIECYQSLEKAEVANAMASIFKADPRIC